MTGLPDSELFGPFLQMTRVADWDSAIAAANATRFGLSAGLIGGPGLGYAKDRFTAESLQKDAPAAYASAKASSESNFLFLAPVTAVAGDKLEAAKKAGEKGSADQKAIVAANQAGDRATLKADSFIPLTMAAIYLLLLFYFIEVAFDGHWLGLHGGGSACFPGA